MVYMTRGDKKKRGNWKGEEEKKIRKREQEGRGLKN